MLNLNNVFVRETCAKSCVVDSLTKFFSFSHYSKNIQKLSVKLTQSGCKLAPSVNLGVYHCEKECDFRKWKRLVVGARRRRKKKIEVY